SPITAMRRPGCASGAARPSRRATSRRSPNGSTGPSARPRTRCPRRREHLPASGPVGWVERSETHRPNRNSKNVDGLRAFGADPSYDSNETTAMTTPRVLISDALSPAAVQIFKDRGVEVDFQPNLGKDKEKLAEIIGNYDGLAIRSATKVTPKVLEKAKTLRVIGRAGIGVDNVDIPAATAKGIIVMNTPFGN